MRAFAGFFFCHCSSSFGWVGSCYSIEENVNMLGAAEMVVKREHSSHLNKTLGPFLA